MKSPSINWVDAIGLAFFLRIVYSRNMWQLSL